MVPGIITKKNKIKKTTFLYDAEMSFMKMLRNLKKLK